MNRRSAEADYLMNSLAELDRALAHLDYSAGVCPPVSAAQTGLDEDQLIQVGCLKFGHLFSSSKGSMLLNGLKPPWI